MKKIFYSALVLLVIPSVTFMSGCKKAASVDGHVATINTAGSVTSFIYDNQGRLTSITDANGTTAIAYTPSSVTLTSGGSSSVFPLNNQGYAANDGNGTSYTYDNNGYLTSIVSGGTTTTYAVSGGDVTSVISNNVTQDAYTFMSNTDYRNYGFSFLGKNSRPYAPGIQSSHLVQNDISGAVTYTHTYTFDSKGRVQTETTQGNGGSNTSVYTYTTN